MVVFFRFKVVGVEYVNDVGQSMRIFALVGDSGATCTVASLYMCEHVSAGRCVHLSFYI